MHEGLIIHERAFKNQPMNTNSENETENDKDKTEINNKEYETIRKLVKSNDKVIKTIK